MSRSPNSINVFHSDKWNMAFSNFPSPDGYQIDVKAYELLVKNVALPDLSIDTLNSDFMQYQIRHSNSRANDNLPQLTIEFKMNEDMTNYYNIFNWIQSLRYHDISNDEDVFRKYLIKSIDINMLDNQKRITGRFRFLNCFPASVGSLSLQYGSPEEITFPIAFIYEEIKLEQFDVA